MTLILFCADWCSSCREFKPTFDAFHLPGLSRYWVDIENDENTMPGIEIENLPSVFVLSNDKLSWYFGEIRPSSLFLEKILSDLEAGKFESKPIEPRFINLLENINDWH
jgi:thiol-disulfide isomerase/thioredoxin